MEEGDQGLSKAHRRPIEDGKLIELANSLDITAYMDRFLGQQTLSSMNSRITDIVGRSTDLGLLSSKSLKTDRKDVLEACFKMIEESSAQDYSKSEIKWSSAKKRKEMILPDMRYLVLSEDLSSSFAQDGGEKFKCLGFISFMLTYEDHCEVIYVYEIHLDVKMRSQGIGTTLLTVIEGIGQKAGVVKCMLTVFKSNQKAVRWYQRCGYNVDAFSPGPRVLRNGTVKEPSYLILSKMLVADAQAA